MFLREGNVIQRLSLTSEQLERLIEERCFPRPFIIDGEPRWVEEDIAAFCHWVMRFGKPTPIPEPPYDDLEDDD